MSKPFDYNKFVAEQPDSMISKIVLRDVATYDKQGVTFTDLQRVNFIYGGNGCGKTTLSRLLQIAGQARNEGGIKNGPFKHCAVEWTGVPLKVLVYNKDFREHNLKENIPGVFTLGEASVEAMKEIDDLRQKTTALSQRKQSLAESVENFQRLIRRENEKMYEALWKEFYPFTLQFYKCTEGIETKEQLAKPIFARVNDGSFRKAKALDELKEGYAALFDHDGLRLIDPVAMPDDTLAEMQQLTADAVWQRCIVGSENVPIAKLIKILHLDDWVRQGREALVKSEKLKMKSDVCPFCQQHTVDDALRAQLEEFFDVDYQQNLTVVRSLMKRYKELRSRLASQLAECRSRAHGVVKVELLSAQIDALLGAVDTNLRIMNNKLNNPGMAATFKKADKAIAGLRRQVELANAAIAENNRLAQDVEAARREWENEMWRCLAAKCAAVVLKSMSHIKMREFDLKGKREELDKVQKEIKRLSREIRERQALMASIQPTIDSINNALKSYGFTSFSIKPTKRGNFYQIQRDDGSLATQTLSEGEMTFLTFLYYMQLVKGSVTKSDLNQPKVLVIDDPISSLDSNIMYVVTTMLRQLIKEVRSPKGKDDHGVRQIFVLSHNVFFYKEVSFVNTRANRQKDTYHWILFKNGNKSDLRPFGQENTIRGAYEQLWYDLKEGHERMDSNGLQNVMRRIIETYFVMFGGYDKRRLIPDHFSDNPEELAIVTSLAKWADEGSHSASDDFYMESPQIMNEKYMAVFRQLFVKLGHEAHYNMMMGF